MPHTYNPNRRQVLGMMAAGTALPLVRSLPTAQATTTRPNVLLLMTDQERADVALPDGFTLPVRASLARRGVSFGMHHTPTAPCSPARSTIFTGLQAPANGILDNVGNTEYTGLSTFGNDNANPSLSTTIPTVGTVLRAAGYRTSYIGKWHLSDPVADDSGALSAYGFDEAIDILGGGSPNEGLEHDPGVAEHAQSWLRAHRNDSQPWLCVVSLINPHDMMFCPRFYRLEDVPDHGAAVPENFQSDLSSKPRVHTLWRAENLAVGGFMPNEVSSAPARRQWQQWGNWYLELLRRTDRLLGMVLSALDGGQHADTVVIQMADHGEMGGAHGLRQKGAMIYRENLRVPLVIADPRRPQTHGAHTRSLTSHVDLLPTLAALTGAQVPDSTVGRDLTPVLDSPAHTVRDALLITSDAKSSGGLPGVNYCIRGVITERYSFGRYSTADHLVGPSTTWEYELYDRHNDPLELRNLAHSSPATSPIAELNVVTDQLISRELRPLPH